MADAMREAFDRWYADQRHQLSNEVVCRVIWERAWCTAVQQPAQGEAVAWRAIHKEGWPFPWEPMPFPEEDRGYFDHHKMRIEYAFSAPPAPSVPDALRESYGCNPSYINGWNACRAALLAAGGKPAVPDGWKLVPVEPTDGMLIAARDWSNSKYGKPVGDDGAMGCYAAMLAAAQEVPRG